MPRSSILLRHLTVVRRGRDSTRAYVTELVGLVGLLVAQYVTFWFSFRATLESYPWLPLVLMIPIYPRVHIKMTRESVTMRWWLGVVPVPLGRRDAMSAEGIFECEESMEGNDAWTVEYSEGGLFVFALFPSRLADTLNVELKRRREGSTVDHAPEARAVKTGPTDK
jgi:hypothetical protein